MELPPAFPRRASAGSTGRAVDGRRENEPKRHRQGVRVGATWFASRETVYGVSLISKIRMSPPSVTKTLSSPSPISAEISDQTAGLSAKSDRST